MPKPIHKHRSQMSIDELIADSGWFKGTERDWQRLSSEERQRLAFTATGCQIAWASWEAPVNCVHPWCQVARGERKPITVLNSQMQYERASGWWRNMDRAKLARVYRAFRKAAREQQVFDIWKLGWQTVVFTGLEI